MEYKSTILIVDDNIAGRETLKGLLFGRGYNLLFASDGMEALQKAEKFTPDLILLDVMMPGMDGYEVCQHLRANPKVAEVPVIMVTALDDRDSRLRGIEAGADDFVSKPFDHAELRKRVQTITRLNRYRRLLSERTKFEWVVEQADDGYLIINDNDQILYANSQARLYLNLPPQKDQLSTQPFLQLAQTQYNAEPAAAWAVWPHQAMASLPRYLVRPATTHANPFWLQIDIVDMNAGDTEEHLVRLRDVTIKVSDQRSMWTFHGQISHKLRTPLNHLFASMDMIDDKDMACVNEDTKTFFSIARHGATRLKNELQDILQFIDAPQLVNIDTEGCRPLDIENIVKNISNLLELKPPTLSFNKISTSNDVQLILGAQAVELILWEIMENAKKFHPEKSPEIHIAVSLTPNQHALIEIADDGLTLSPDQLENMWAPYYQAEKFFTGQVGGTGLGLSLVTSLVWGVGGSCSSHNRTNQPGIIIELKMPLKNI